MRKLKKIDLLTLFTVYEFFFEVIWYKKIQSKNPFDIHILFKTNSAILTKAYCVPVWYTNEMLLPLTQK